MSAITTRGPQSLIRKLDMVINTAVRPRNVEVSMSALPRFCVCMKLCGLPGSVLLSKEILILDIETLMRASFSLFAPDRSLSSFSISNRDYHGRVFYSSVFPLALKNREKIKYNTGNSKKIKKIINAEKPNDEVLLSFTHVYIFVDINVYFESNTQQFYWSESHIDGSAAGSSGPSYPEFKKNKN